MRQKVRHIIIFISLFLFPLTLNYFSPYVSIDGAFQGIVAGSVLMFALLLLAGMIFRRAWCAWLCPVAGLGELCAMINNRPVNRKRLQVNRLVLFGIWFSVLVTGFVLAGGIRGINPLHLTERVVSIDEPLKFITYYMVLAILFALTIIIGRRGACHSICWMSPFLVAGSWIGRMLHLPQLMIRSIPENCINCKRCNHKCPMSIDVNQDMREGAINSYDCIQCSECADVCPKSVLKLSWRNYK